MFLSSFLIVIEREGYSFWGVVREKDCLKYELPGLH